MTSIPSRFISAIVAALLFVLAAETRAQTEPLACRDDPMFRQLDFTVGHWEVYASTRKIAETRLERTLKDCAIEQTWSTVNNEPGNGLGLFTYSRLLKSWGYFWVSDEAQTTAFTGALEGAANMRFFTRAPQSDGTSRLRHWSLILQSDGTIRELATSTLDGKAWVTDYDLFWRRKAGT